MAQLTLESDRIRKQIYDGARMYKSFIYKREELLRKLCPVGYMESEPSFAEIDLTEEDDVHGDRACCSYECGSIK